MNPVPNAGFTLVELLVGLTLLGFLSLLMLSGLETAIGAWHRADATGTAGRDWQGAQDLLRDRLSQAYPAVLTDDAGNHRIDFTGEPDGITFLAPLSERYGARVFVRYRLRLDDRTLRLGWSMLGAETADELGAASLLGELGTIEVRYFGVDDPAEPPHWQRSWIGRSGLPMLIRLHIDPAPEQTALWPDLEVAPLVNADSRCTFDPSDGACRGL